MGRYRWFLPMVVGLDFKFSINQKLGAIRMIIGLVLIILAIIIILTMN